MRILLVRHAKTDANRLNRAAFGAEGAPLNNEGHRQAASLGSKLRAAGVLMDIEPVAVSELIRTQQTATIAGFEQLSVNALLNEISTPDPKRTLELVAQGLLPDEAIKAAKRLLGNPPQQKVWITHGLLIAAITVVLGLTNNANFIPDFCEIREIEL